MEAKVGQKVITGHDPHLFPFTEQPKFKYSSHIPDENPIRVPKGSGSGHPPTQKVVNKAYLHFEASYDDWKVWATVTRLKINIFWKSLFFPSDIFNDNNISKIQNNPIKNNREKSGRSAPARKSGEKAVFSTAQLPPGRFGWNLYIPLDNSELTNISKKQNFFSGKNFQCRPKTPKKQEKNASWKFFSLQVLQILYQFVQIFILRHIFLSEPTISQNYARYRRRKKPGEFRVTVVFFGFPADHRP